MTQEFTYHLRFERFDEHYTPAQDTRLTTNFANLARGESRQANLRRATNMINQRFNSLANWDNPEGDRYTVEVDIVSVDMDLRGDAVHFPIIEMLNTAVFDHQRQRRIEGIVGNNFSSYVRDYDFSVWLKEHNHGKEEFSLPEGFGELHGKLFKDFIASSTYAQAFSKSPVICLSAANSKTYRRSDNIHPILGVEYVQDTPSLTDHYFELMGLKARYFMPRGSVAPFAFYHQGDLLNDYTALELISTISTMETFQKIYRPEIYNANAVAGHVFKPRLANENYSLTQVEYDREERTQLAIAQGQLAQEQLLDPNRELLEQWLRQQQRERVVA